MRETKFRVWDNIREQWEERPCAINKTGNLLIYNVDSGNWFEPQHTGYDVEWFTGLNDKNGKEIYGEGDIYKDADGIISIVKMAVDGWALFPVKKETPVRNLYWHNICNKTKGEIIGNIHQNSDLLEKSE